MKNKFLLLVATTLIISANFAQAADTAATLDSTSTASSHDVAPAESSAPAWKVSAATYFYDFQGTKPAQDNLYSFKNTTLQMQLFTVQYQLSPSWTLLAFGQRMENYVETDIPGFGFYQDKTIGWGDVLLDAVHPIYIGSRFMLFGDVGVSVPTGSINKKNASNPGSNYAYNMQMGSGTLDAQIGTVALYLNPYFQVGTHLNTYQRMGENRNGYRLGNLYKGEGWVDVPVGYGFTPRVVSYYKVKQAIHGLDKTLGRNVLTEYYHHDQANWDVSAALKFERKLIGSATIVAEAGKPITQGSKNSDQVVVSTDYYGTVGVSGTF